MKLDLWYPNQNKEIYPLIYFCHGGGWVSGFRDQPNNVSWCRFLANKGFLVASIDYRYGYSNTMLDLLSDYIAGLEFLKNNNKNLFIDKNNITLMGLSAGGHLALLYSSYFTSMSEEKYMNGIRSVVAYYSPSDLRDILKENNKSLFAKFGLKQTLKDSPYISHDIYLDYSPIKYISKNMVPVFLAHGEEDKTVPIVSSIKLGHKLLDYNVPLEFEVHKSADHSFDTKLKDYRTIKILDKTVRFINKYSSR